MARKVIGLKQVENEDQTALTADEVTAQAAEKLALNFFLAGLFSHLGVCRCLRGSCGDALDRAAFVD
ncbi:MAG: hypothetical protein ACYCRE_05080, partial [Acidobacteriaceae bacterium]